MAKEQMQYADNPMMKLHFAQREKERENHLRERYIYLDTDTNTYLRLGL